MIGKTNNQIAKEIIKFCTYPDYKEPSYNTVFNYINSEEKLD